MTENLCDLCFKIQLLDISILGVKIVVILSGQRVNLKMQVSLEDYCLSLFLVFTALLTLSGVLS